METIKKVFELPIKIVAAEDLRPGDIIHDAAHRNLAGVVESVACKGPEVIQVRAYGEPSTCKLDSDQNVLVTRNPQQK